jgi:Ca-activated chloride channel family protein
MSPTHNAARLGPAPRPARAIPAPAARTEPVVPSSLPARATCAPAARWLVALSFFALSLVAPVPVARAEGPEPASERTLSPYFLVQGGEAGFDRLPLLGTRVRVDVAGVVAHVKVTQSYKNDGTRPLTARYVFPASTRAAVHGLRLTAGDRVVRATIRERQQARQEFETAKKAGKNAALLEQQRPNVFTMDVANVMPGQRVDVQLDYSELLVPTAGVYEFVFPTVVGPRYSAIPERNAAESDRWVATPYLRQDQPPTSTFELEGTVTAGVPIRELASPSHTLRSHGSTESGSDLQGSPDSTASGSGPPRAGRADSSRVTFALDPSEARGGNRDFILRYRLTGDALQAGLMLHQGPGENFFLMMVQPPARVVLDQVPPREYVFVFDVSGSMHGFPLETAKRLLRDLVGSLRPEDTFNVLTFSGGSQLWSPRSLPATPANVRAAVAMLDDVRAGGGTELLAAVTRAMALPVEGASRSLVVVTDGYIAAEREVFDHIRTHLDQANVFAFGIGSGVNRHLIEGLARAGRGEPFVVTSPAEAPDVAARFRDYVRYPLLTGVRVAFEGFDAYDVEPASVPDVLAERPVLVQGKWRGAPSGRIVVTGTDGAGRFERALDVAAVRPDPANHALRELWARTRVADLSDRALSGESDEDRRAIVELGLAYSLLTRHTSFIAVHEVVVNAAGESEPVTQALPLPAGVSDLAVGGMGVGDEPGLAWLLVGACAALGAWAVRRGAAAASGR